MHESVVALYFSSMAARTNIGDIVIVGLLAINLLGQTKNSPANNAQQPVNHTNNVLVANDNQEPTTHPEAAKYRSPGWYTASEWWLVLIAALTGVVICWQTTETRRATQAIRDQAKIAKDALIAQQRPRLSVKHVFVTPPADITQVGDCREWKIGCIVANVGGSRAEVTDSNITIHTLGVGTLKALLPAIPIYDGKYSFGTFAVEPGERRSMDVVLETNTDGMKLRLSHKMAERVDSYGQPHRDTSPVVCYGFFKYRDDSGVLRISGFGSQWNRMDMSFNRMENTNYNYED